MRYIFFGTPEFGAIVLRELLAAGWPPAAVVANPDRPVGRAQTITPPPTKRVVAEQAPHIHVLQPEKLDGPFRDRLIALAPDLFVVAAYAKIIPQEILDIPRLGTIGVHPSLLPLFRGASPIQSALLLGAKETGVTLYLMDRHMGHGPIVAAERLADYDPAHDTTARLLPRLAALGGQLLARTLPSVEQGTMRTTAQDDARATLARKFRTEDGFIDERDLLRAERGEAPELSVRFDRMIRSLNPEPGVWTLRNGRRTKLLAAELRGDGLRLTVIQPEGKRPQTFSG